MGRKVIATWVSLVMMLSLIVIIIEIAQVVEAPTIWYVDDVPGSGGPGNPPEDFTSIQDSINASSDGDTVFVYSGTYYENVVMNKTISLIGESKSNTIINASGTSRAIKITSSYVNISRFTITSSDAYGIDIQEDCANITDCIIQNNGWFGILLSWFRNVTIRGNNISWNTKGGIYVRDSEFNTIEDNTFFGNNIIIDGDILSNWNTHSMIGNSVNGRPMYYYKNEVGIIVPSNAAAVILANCSDIDINGINASDADVGVTGGFSSNITINNSLISGNYENGLEFYMSNRNRIHNSIISNNGLHGIFFGYLCSNNSLLNNSISDNEYGGILFYSNVNYSTIIGNYISNNSVTLWMSSNNTIRDNNMTGKGISVSWHSCYNNISYNNITLGGYGIGLSGYSDYNSILGNTILENNGIGISIRSSFNIINQNDILFNSEEGIKSGSPGSNNVIYGNNISWNGNKGIYLYSQESEKIINNSINGNEEEGIYLYNSKDMIIENNSLFYDGIVVWGDNLDYWNSHKIENNFANGRPLYYYKNESRITVPSNASAVILANCTGLIIEKVNASNVDTGVQIGYSSNCTIKDSKIIGNKYGIHIYSSDDSLSYNHTIIGNNISESNWFGIYQIYSKNNTIFNNNIYNNEGGVFTSFSNYNIISDNHIYKNSEGIGLSQSNYNYITDNFLKDNTIDGIGIHGSQNNILENNTVFNNSYYGLVVANSFEHTIRHNNISLSGYYGMFIRESSFLLIENNTFQNDSILLWDGDIEHWNTHSIQNNTANGKPIYYFRNASRISVPSDAASVIFGNCSNSIIEDLNLSLVDVGIVIGFSSNCTIKNSTVSQNYPTGIFLYSSNNNTISDNNISKNNNYGILFRSVSNNNTIEDNYIQENNRNGIYFHDDANGNTIKNNNISKNGRDGISIYSNYNVVRNNIISMNDYRGIYFSGSDNIAYHNNLINNDYQASSSWNNFWDSGYPGGGNFWSDYEGNDSYYGLDQNISGRDGIGDTPYYLTPGRFDKYPLMQPFPTGLLPQIHLISPENNSIITQSVILNLDVYDSDLDFVNYSLDGGDFEALLPPYNISTQDWTDGLHEIIIRANDTLKHSSFKTYYFTFDSTGPMVILNSPQNNSIIKYGEVLNFSIQDPHLKEVNYSVDGGANLSFSQPFDISTEGWDEGNHIIQINAKDSLNNSISSWFSFTLDFTVPTIYLNFPQNNSYQKIGVILEFIVFDTNIAEVNFSVNEGTNISVTPTFNITTTGWSDGDYLIKINALDIAGNLNSSMFQFTIDSTKPIIILNSPQNNSFILEGMMIDITIIDTNLMQVNYSINGGPEITIPSPFNISTAGWPDGNYTIQINAIDLAGNSESSWFFFSIDSKVPSIVINDPKQNSVIQSGTILDFVVEDLNLTLVNYSINGGVNILLNEPHDISTIGWPDGGYTIIIRALDIAGNLNSLVFFFTLDSTKPDIILKSPENGSLISNKTIIEFIVTDSNLEHVNYSINGEDNLTTSDKFNITTAEWKDGNYTIQINAKDLAGNYYSALCWFMMDSTPPSIMFDPTLNHSTIYAGKEIQIDISDENINVVMYSVNQGAYNILLPSYIIDTISWSDGIHSIYIMANDTAGNEIIHWFEIIVDSVPPFVVSSQPQNQEIDIEISTSIIITFSESMEQTGVEDYMTLSPYIEYTFKWEQSQTILNISFETNKLAENTTYYLEIDKQIKDLNGNPMISDFKLEFTTKTSTPIQTPKSEEPEFPYLILAIVIIVVVVLILLIFLLTRGKKEGETKVEPEEVGPKIQESMAQMDSGGESEEGISWIQEETTPLETTSPVITPIKPQPQVKCPRCNEMFSIDTSVVPYVMNCPHCGLKGKVKSR